MLLRRGALLLLLLLSSCCEVMLRVLFPCNASMLPPFSLCNGAIWLSVIRCNMAMCCLATCKGSMFANHACRAYAVPDT